MECSGDNEGRATENHQGGRSLSGSHLELLFFELESTGEEGTSENEEQVGEDRSEKRGLNNSKFTSDQGEDTDDQFDLSTRERSVLDFNTDQHWTYSVSEGSVEETSNGLTQFESALFSRFSQKRCERNDGDERAVRQWGVYISLCRAKDAERHWTNMMKSAVEPKIRKRKRSVSKIRKRRGRLAAYPIPRNEKRKTEGQRPIER